MKKNFLFNRFGFVIGSLFFQIGCGGFKQTFFNIESENQAWIASRLEHAQTQKPSPQSFPSIQTYPVQDQQWTLQKTTLETYRETLLKEALNPINPADNRIKNMIDWRDRLIIGQAQYVKEAEAQKIKKQKLEDIVQDLLKKIEK